MHSPAARLILEILLATGVGLGIAVLPLPWAALLVLGSVLGLGVLECPVLLLALIALSVPFGSVREFPLAGFTVGVGDVMTWAAAGLLLARTATSTEKRLPKGFPPGALSFGIFYGAMALSTLNALSLEYALKELVRWAELFVLWVAAFNLVDDDDYPLALGGLLLAGAAEAAVGIRQFLGQIGPEHFVVLGRFMRAYGHFMQPNPFGGYMGLVLPLAVGLAVGLAQDAWLRRGPALALAAAASASAALLTGAALVMSWSRGAWLGALVAMAVVGGFYSRRVALASLAALILVAALVISSGAGLLPEVVSRRFADVPLFLGAVDIRTVEVTDENYALVERLAHWYAAQRMWEDHFWTGVGIGNYEPVYPKYALPRWTEPLGHAHNYYLNVAAETGSVGLVAYLLLWGSVFFCAFKALRRSQGWRRGLAVGITGVLAHLSVHNFFDNLYVHWMYLHVGMLLGLLGSLCCESASQSGSAQSTAPRLE